MPSRPPKVAYTVFRGRQPGVYSTHQEANEQVHGFPSSQWRGYVETDGGYNEAVRAFGEYVKEQQIAAKQLQTPPKSQCLKKKDRPPSWQAQKDSSGKIRRIGYCQGIFTADKSEAHRTTATTSRVRSGSDSSDDSSESFSSEEVTSSARSTSSEDTGSKEPPHAGGESSTCNGSLDNIGYSQSLHRCLESGASSRCSTSDSSSLSDDITGRDDSGDKERFEQRRALDSYVNAPSILNRTSDFLQYLVDQKGNRFRSSLDKPSNLESEHQECQKYFNKSQYNPSRSAISDAVSNTSTDYGDFPNDLGLVKAPDPPSIKVDPAASDEDDTDYGEFFEDAHLLESLGFPAPRTEPKLCDEQRELVNLILSGDNVFYTGSAGCGKSTVLRTFVREMKAQRKRVHIIAYTGRAALEAGGVTLHNYAGWTPASLAKPIKRLKKEAHGMKNWRRFISTDVLVIDEISMVENHLFERLNRIMSDSREDDRPFGGVQVIVTGDFCQLPPVKPFQNCMECGNELLPLNRGREYQCQEPKCKDHGLCLYDRDKWAFRSEAWKECNFKHINLKKVHRQKDMRFINILEKYRFGQSVSVEEKSYLLRKGRDDIQKKVVSPKVESAATEACVSGNGFETPFTVKLFPRRDDVAKENKAQLALIDNECLEFVCLDKFDWNQEHEGLDRLFQEGVYKHTLKALDEHHLDAVLELKKDMPVVLLVNLDFDAGLINGSQGFIVGFEAHELKNLPDLLGGHARRRERLVQVFAQRAHYKRWPIVRFPDANNRQQTIYPRCMMSELGDGGEFDEDYSLLSRTQIPLAAGWAITIHKSQGMTLSQAEVSLDRAFEQSQRYVALSRVREVEGLTITGFGESNQGANPQVMEFLTEKGLLDTSSLKERDVKAMVT